MFGQAAHRLVEGASHQALDDRSGEPIDERRLPSRAAPPKPAPRARRAWILALLHDRAGFHSFLRTLYCWATTDVQEVGSQPDFRVTFARMAARLPREMSRRHRVKDRVERALGVVKAFSVAVPAGVQLKLDVQPATGWRTPAIPSRT
jgi:hypothetical protein